MKKAAKKNWVNTIKNGPGPNSVKEGAMLTLKGLAMGSADLVPGVSGGTIALITGIYSQLLKAVSSISIGLKHILQLNFKEGFAAIHTKFLICLALGVGTAIISLARLMHYLLTTHPVPTWGLFLGLVAASVLIIGKEAKVWIGLGPPLFIAGSAAAFFIVGMIPVATPEALWFIFVSGMIAICAMILPGISGAFLLLILGKYQFITGTLKAPFNDGNPLIILVFCCGCLCGLLGFSRFLSYMIDRHYHATMATLTGLMFGSMRKIWPWKEIIDSITIRGKVHVLNTSNIMPPEFNSEFYITICLAIMGCMTVLILHKAGNKTNDQ